MNSDELAALYQKCFLNTKWKPLNEERKNQYKYLLPSETKLIDELSQVPIAELVPSLGKDHLESLRQLIIGGNPGLSKNCLDASIILVDSLNDLTGCRQEKGGGQIILVDAHLMLFIWIMNKAAMYGQSSGEYSRDLLTCVALLFYATRLPLYGFNGKQDISTIEKVKEFPLFKTPPHPNTEALKALSAETYLHELYVLAHEMAHLELGHLNKNQPLTRTVYPVSDIAELFLRDAEGRLEAEKEMAADSMAVDLLIRTLSKDSQENTEVVLTSIFRLSRYFLWLELVRRRGSEQGNFLWAARHHQLREKIMQVYRWDNPGFIISELEWLEDHMERGAFQAAEVYKMICENKMS